MGSATRGLTMNERMLENAIAAVRLACIVTRKVQSELDKVVRLTKDDRSPVTVADFAAQAVIAHALQAGEHNLRLVGEESSKALRSDGFGAIRTAVVEAVRGVWPEADSDSVLHAIDLGGHDASGDSYWTLDPVDGTKGFIRGQQYAISLAFIERGRVIAGVLGCPNLSADFTRSFDRADPSGQVFYARGGGGSWCLPVNGSGANPNRIHARSAAQGPIQVCESVEAEHSKQDDTARILKYLGGAGVPARLDSQCKYAVIARGQADAYLRLPTRKGYIEKIWDHAAGQIVAAEAGAVVTDIDGRRLDFGHGTGLSRNRGIVCASSAYHGRIIAAIKTLGLSQTA
jgi:3'(2'), 5'-bisphosphate nucleotidase